MEMCSRCVDLRTHASRALGNHVTLTFDLSNCGSVHAEHLSMKYANFGDDSSSRFPVRARTDRQTYPKWQTQPITLPTQWRSPALVT